MSVHQDDEWFSFEANFEGHEPQEFITLQDALNYADWCGAGVNPPAGEWRCWPTRGEGPTDHRPLTTPSRSIC